MKNAQVSNSKGVPQKKLCTWGRIFLIKATFGRLTNQGGNYLPYIDTVRPVRGFTSSSAVY